MAEIKVFDPVRVPVSVLGELQELRALVEQLRRDNECLRQDNARLQRELDQARAERDDARRQSKRQAAPFAKGPPAPAPKRPGRKAGPAHGRHGHRLPPPPEQIDEVLEAPLPESCPNCGGLIEEAEVVSQYQTEIPRRPILRQFNVHRGACRGCGRPVQGRHPLQTSDALGAAASQMGAAAQAGVVLLNKTAGLPHGKIAQFFGSFFGIRLTRGACAQIVLRAAGRLRPAYEEVLQEVRASPVLTPDETGWRVGGQPAWLHAWVGERATGYVIDPKRSADALEEVIGSDWGGVLVHDGFASYDRFEQATHQQCLGHPLRRARELLAVATRGAVHYPQRLIALFTEAIHLRNRYLRGEVKRRAVQRARAEFDRRLIDLAWPPRVVDEYETFSEHLWQHRGEWFTFLSRPEVEATNWQAEQAIRPAVVNRKVWGGNRTWAGAAAQGVLLSVLRTCWQTECAPLDFISQTLCAFGNPHLPPPALLPPR
jgi:transposase